MTRSELIRFLLLPSTLSGTFITFVAVAVLSGQAWSFISHNQLFYDFLFGQHGIATALINAPDVFVLIRRALNSTLAYYIALTVGAAIIGIAVYELLELGKNVVNSRTLLQKANAGELKEKLARLGVRSLGLVVWALYVLFFITVFVSFVSLLLQTGIQSINNGDNGGWLQLALAFAATWIGLHAHIIFLRLCFLRPRLFGGWDVELASE